MLEKGLCVADKFRLVRELARGGMASIWLADHLGLDIPCAVKFIETEQSLGRAELRARFEREAKAAAQIRSQHVVQILDHGVWRDMPYIAMEYLEGEDLGQRLERERTLSYADVVRIVSHVARALTKAHWAGIVHRDLKPENIFLVQGDEGEIAKVLDFGIAKRTSLALHDSGTRTGTLVGTPYYMSPEQASGVRAIDHRSDLFSLAIIAYQCIVGDLPFYSEGLGELFGQILYEALPIPSQASGDVPAGFDAWWLKAAARDPEDRYQTAKELADALAIALGVPRTIDASVSVVTHVDNIRWPALGASGARPRASGPPERSGSIPDAGYPTRDAERPTSATPEPRRPVSSGSGPRRATAPPANRASHTDAVDRRAGSTSDATHTGSGDHTTSWSESNSDTERHSAPSPAEPDPVVTHEVSERLASEDDTAPESPPANRLEALKDIQTAPPSARTVRVVMTGNRRTLVGATAGVVLVLGILGLASWSSSKAQSVVNVPPADSAVNLEPTQLAPAALERAPSPVPASESSQIAEAPSPPPSASATISMVSKTTTVRQPTETARTPRVPVRPQPRPPTKTAKPAASPTYDYGI